MEITQTQNKRPKGPRMYDLTTLIQAGIDPKTGLPLKVVGGDTCHLKDKIKATLRVLDEQNAVRRFKWYNLPSGLTGELIEQMLYNKGELVFFYMEADGNFYALPYTLHGGIDCYGRYRAVTPLPYNGEVKDEKSKPWIPGLVKNVVYDPMKDISIDDLLDGCVILKDYSAGIPQNKVPRKFLQEPILDAMAEAFPMARTSLIANSGVKGMRVNDEDQQVQVKLASQSVSHASLTGDPWIPIVGNIEFQDLTNAGSAMKSEEYLLYMQALDNYRLSLYGLKNGGLFQKKSHMLEAEQEMNMGTTELVMEDSLLLRQRFCDIVNSIWGLGIWCEPAEVTLGLPDMNQPQETDGQYESNESNDEGVEYDE